MKGIVFTLDAIVAFGIIVAIISGLVYFRIDIVSPYLSAQRLHLMSEDILSILSSSKLGEIANETLLNQYIADGTLGETDLSKKTMDVIGALWSAGKREEAANITNDILENFIPNNTGYQIMINEDDFYNSSGTSRPEYDDASIRISSGRIISGYEKYKPVSGYVARAWATKIKRTVIKLIPINLEWGGFSENEYWNNGYGPAELRGLWSIILKNFTIPDDANISYAYMQLATDNDCTGVKINDNIIPSINCCYGCNRGDVREFNITSYVFNGLNTVNITFRNINNTDDPNLAHFHPGCYIKIKYNTSEVESGSNETVFNADFIRGAPSANEIIPFFVNAQIRNVTAFVDVRDINAFLLLTLNYKWNASNPLQNVLLYREYPEEVDDCGEIINEDICEECGCSWADESIIQENILTYDDFEDNVWGNWHDGGGDASISFSWNKCDSTGGTGYSANLQDNSGTSSAIWHESTIDVNTTNYTAIKIDFWFLPVSFESGEDWFIEYYNGSSWQTTATYTVGTNFTNNNEYHKVIWINETKYTFPTNMRIRFRSDASSDDDDLYLDCINITAFRELTGSCSGIQNNCGGTKNRTYDIFFNETGSLIEEHDFEGTLLNTWFNTNVTLNNIFSDKTNVLGIYADIRPPQNISTSNGMDWQRLGMFAHDDTAGYENDKYCYITERSNVTVYHDIERYGLEYGKIDINAIDDFVEPEKNCITEGRACKDAILNLTFSFPTSIFKTTILGTQDWGGHDNGYNFIWMWVNETEPEEAHFVMSTDTPPGTFSNIPASFLQIDNINIIRVGDKDSGDRDLNTEISPLMGHARSIVDYSFLIPSQVGYGDVFEYQTDATDDAERRLNDILGSFASATVIQKDSFRVGGVPYMYGPFSFRVNVWV